MRIVLSKLHQFFQIATLILCSSLIALVADATNNSSQLIKDCEYCPQMIVIEPGEFIMGSPASVEGSRDDERPQRKVHIEYFFAAGQYEVKRREFEQFIKSTDYDMSGGCYGATENGIQLGKNLNWYDPGYPVSDDHPVVCVSWNDAKAYTKWLSTVTGYTYRLFSESEWEYYSRSISRRNASQANKNCAA